MCTAFQDKHSNSLIVQGPPEDVKKVIALIDSIDIPSPQVKLKAFIVETSSTTAQQLGVQWGGLLKNTYFQMSPGQAGTISNTRDAGNSSGTSSTSSTFGGQSPGMTTSSTATNAGTASSALSNAMTPVFGGGTSGQGFAINNPASLTSAATGLGASGTALNFLFGKIGQNVLEAQLTALAEEGKANILSSPSITTMENQTASVENGKDIPYQTVSQSGTNVQWLNATLKVEMTPHVIDGINLRMKIMVKDDQVDENKDSWVQGNPPIYKRETKSNLIVEDGETIVISGLTRDISSGNDSGVPFLSNIPGIGWAFKSKSKSQEKYQILIFITPTILRYKPIENVPQSQSAPAIN